MIVYYSLSKYIGCPPDQNIRTCSPIFLYENIECFENSLWNPVKKKCECVAGFYMDSKTQTCQKCNCSGYFSQCFGSATDCNDEPYYSISVSQKNNVVDSACMTKGNEGKSQLLVWDGQYGSQYTVDLKERKEDWFRSYTLPAMSSEPGKSFV